MEKAADALIPCQFEIDGKYREALLFRQHVEDAGGEQVDAAECGDMHARFPCGCVIGAVAANKTQVTAEKQLPFALPVPDGHGG